MRKWDFTTLPPCQAFKFSLSHSGRVGSKTRPITSFEGWTWRPIHFGRCSPRLSQWYHHTVQTLDPFTLCSRYNHSSCALLLHTTGISVVSRLFSRGWPPVSVQEPEVPPDTNSVPLSQLPCQATRILPKPLSHLHGQKLYATVVRKLLLIQPLEFSLSQSWWRISLSWLARIEKP